jgi:hypothetical protein
LDGTPLHQHLRYNLEQKDPNEIRYFLDDAARILYDKPIPANMSDSARFANLDELSDWLKKWESSDDVPDMDELIDQVAKAQYDRSPYELIEPVSVGAIDANIGKNTFAFGNDEVGYQLFVDGNRVTNTDNVAYSRTEAELQLRDKMQEGSDTLRMEGDEIWDDTYKSYVDESLPGGSNYREVVFAWDEAPKTHKITTHFPDEDAIASALIRDRKLADGKNSLHVDELQSDLHTAGSKSGYELSDYETTKVSESIKGLLKENDNYEYAWKFGKRGIRELTDANVFLSLEDINHIAKDIQIRGRTKNFGSKGADKLVKSLGKDKIINISEKAKPFIYEGDIPNYPFKEDYHVMGLKQLLLDAVSEGKDALSVSGSYVMKSRYSDKYHKFYETLYDKKIPSAMKKLANKYGGEFEKGKLDLEDTFGVSHLRAPHLTSKGREANIIVITPEMKEKILKEGVELFGKGGRVGSTLDEPLEGNTKEIL